MRYILVGSSIALLAFGSLVSRTTEALEPQTTDPGAVMQAAYVRPLGDRATTRVEMSIREGDRTRKRTLLLRAKAFEGGRKILVRVDSPAELSGTAFLNVDYLGGERADDQWLYMPSLHRVTRIVSSGMSGSFLGSDLSYADMSVSDPKAYTLKMLQPSAQVGGEDCWVVEAVPRTDKEREETGYEKKEIWISKRTLVALRIKAWLQQGQKVKYVEASGLKNVDGIWLPEILTARTVQNTKLLSETTLRTLNAKFDDASVKDEDFTPSRLEQGS
jgi:hypothetical protein